MEQEFALFKKSYPDMHFTEVRPSIQSDGSIKFPTRREYVTAWRQVVRQSLSKYYFGVYYTGMAQEGTGNWVVMPDKQNPEEESKYEGDEVSLITLTDVFQLTEEEGYNNGYIWMSIDCPFGGNWII